MIAPKMKRTPTIAWLGLEGFLARAAMATARALGVLSAVASWSGCSPSGALPVSAPATATQAQTATASAGPADPMATWPALPRDGVIVRPKLSSYEPSKRPTIVVFFASWCEGCVDALLSDVELKRRVGSTYRVGLALLEEEEDHFETFAAAIRASVDLEAWRVDGATKALRERCRIGSFPAWCILDEQSNVVASGEGGDIARALELVNAHQPPDVDAAMARAGTAIKASAASPADAALRADALAAAREPRVTWRTKPRGISASEGSAPELSVGLARDAADAAHGLDIATLDTYAFALSRAGRAAEAVAVQTRTLAECDLVAAPCGEERKRFEEFKSR